MIGVAAQLSTAAVGVQDGPRVLNWAAPEGISDPVHVAEPIATVEVDANDAVVAALGASPLPAIVPEEDAPTLNAAAVADQPVVNEVLHGAAVAAVNGSM